MPYCYGKTMLIESMRVSNLAQFAMQLLIQNLEKCLLLNVKLARIDFMERAYRNGFKLVERANAFYASNHGQVLILPVVNQKHNSYFSDFALINYRMITKLSHLFLCTEATINYQMMCFKKGSFVVQRYMKNFTNIVTSRDCYDCQKSFGAMSNLIKNIRGKSTQ